MEVEDYKNKQKEFFYFDNNGTTFMHILSKYILNLYLDQGNPSGNYELAKKSKNKIIHL